MAIWLLNLSCLWVPPQPAGAQAQVMSYSYYYRGVVADPIITHSKCTGLNAQCPFPSGQERAVSTTPVCAVFLKTTSALMLQNHRWPSPLKRGKMYRWHYYTWNDDLDCKLQRGLCSQRKSGQGWCSVWTVLNRWLPRSEPYFHGQRIGVSTGSGVLVGLH